METEIENNNQAFNLTQALSETYQDVTRQIVDHIPQLMGALALLLAGWFAAWLLALLTRKLMKGVDKLILHSIHKRGLMSAPTRSYAKLGENIVFWSVLLFFLASSANLLEWKVFSDVTGALLNYLPNVLSGVLIILAGFFISSIARTTVVNTASSMDIVQAELLARIAQVTVVLTAAIVGVEQLGINVDFMTTTLIVVAGVLLSGAALAFALGAKNFVANIIGAKTSRKHYQLSQLIRLGDIEGHLLEITPTTIVLDTEHGRAVFPAKMFHEQISQILSETQEGDRSPVGVQTRPKGD